MTEILEFKKESLSADELELRFYEDIQEIMVSYQEKGMTASWQVGCLGNIYNQMGQPDE